MMSLRLRSTAPKAVGIVNLLFQISQTSPTADELKEYMHFSETKMLSLIKERCKSLI